MEGFEGQRPPPTTEGKPHTTHSSFLGPNHRRHPQFTPSSPSPDMEAAVERFCSSADPSSSSSPGMQAAVQRFCCRAGDPSMSSSSASFWQADAFMADASLEYVNEILMTEELEDALPADADAQASYHALLKNFYDIIGQPLPPHLASFEHSEHAASVVCCPDPSASAENQLIDPRDMSCNRSMCTETIKSLGELSSLHNGREAPVLMNSPGSFEHQKTSKGLTAASSIDISFEELKAQADYACLYVETLSLSDIPSNEGQPSSTNGPKKKSSKPGRKGARYVKIDTSVAPVSMDLKDLLMICAQEIAMGNVKRANQMLHELYQVHGVSVQGNSLQRIAHYFCDALVARMAGLGGHQYRIMCENKPSMVSFLKASRIWYQMIPIPKITHFFANQNILKVAAGGARLHILDFGIKHGMQWPCLINALADQDAGPPLLVITGIEDPKADKKCLEKLKATGRRLAAYANRYQVPFQFHTLVSETWEKIDPASLQLQKGEVLVINCVQCLYHLADDGDDPTSVSPRQKLLMRMCNLNPHLLLVSEYNLAGSSPFFVLRFRETLHYYYNTQDMLDTICCDDPDGLLVEQTISSSFILNIVACEGAERVQRPATFKQWGLHIKRAGFELLVIPSDVLCRAKSYVKQHYHSDFMVADGEKGWLLLGWKGRVKVAISAWKPSCIVR